MTSPDELRSTPGPNRSGWEGNAALLDAIPPPETPRPIQWRAAWKRFAELSANPEQTDLAFRFFHTLGGNDDFVFQRFLASEAGRSLLARRPSLVRALADREALAALPEGSFGRAYLGFKGENGFAAEGLLEAHDASLDVEVSDPFRRWFWERVTVMHDLWHVLTGYGTDEGGEAHLLAFSLAHIPIRSIRVTNVLILLRAPWRDGFLFQRGLLAARRRGRRSAALITAPFEDWLARPLEEVRGELRIAPLANAHPDGLMRGSQDDWAILPATALAEDPR